MRDLSAEDSDAPILVESNGTATNNGEQTQNGGLPASKCLVLDLGTANTKAGWSTANRGEPELVIPSVVGHGRHKGAMLTLGLSDSYVGRQAQSLQGILNLRQPFRQGCVQHWDDLELLWSYVWKQESKRIRVIAFLT